MSCAKLRRNRRKPYLLKFSQIETNTIRMTQRETTLDVITKECKKPTRETRTEFHKIRHTWLSGFNFRFGKLMKLLVITAFHDTRPLNSLNSLK